MKVRLMMAGGALFLFALASGTLVAQDHGQDQDHHDQDRHNQPNNRGQEHSKFDDHDRQVSRDWYNQHHNHPPAGLRDRDRLPPEYESRLQDGYVLDRNMRGRIHSVPADYYRQLPAPPRGDRYVFIGGHTVMIDGGYRVHDVIHFELNY